MAIFDDLERGLKSPMWSVMTPSSVQVRNEDGKSTEELLFIPEDGDTKSADPESWMTAKDYGGRVEVDKELLMNLPGLEMSVYLVDIPTKKSVLNFVDDEEVPVGEIWVNENTKHNSDVRSELLKNIILSYLVSKGGNALDDARHIVSSIEKVMNLDPENV